MKKAIKGFAGYIKELIAGADGKGRVRAGLAVFFSMGLFCNITYCTYVKQQVDITAMGMLSGLVFGLLGLTTQETIKLNQNATNKEL